MNLVLAPSLVFLAAALPVPFIPQQPGQCGPAALAMLANYYGHDVSQEEIAGAIHLPEIGGALTAELVEYARRLDLWVRQYRGSPEDLRQKLRAGVPLILLGKFGRQPHYFVALDFDDFAKTLTVHSDTRAHLQLRQEDFLRWWDRAGRWTLLVCPPERVTWKLSAEEHNDLGVFQERAGRLEAAAGHYRAAAGLKPGNSYFRMNLGNALLKQRRLGEAADAFAQAIALDPQNADAMNNLAHTRAEMNEDLDEAARLCEQAVQLRPSRRAYYLDTLGSIRLKQGRTAEAIAAFESALAATTERQGSLRAGIAQRLAAARALLEK